MLKIRLQGTTNDIKWFKKILERDKRITVLDISETSTMYRTLPGIRKYSKTGQKDSCNAYISHICSVEEKNKNLFYLSG